MFTTQAKLTAAGIGALALAMVLIFLWPIRTVATGYQGVVTVGGNIRGIQPSGFVFLWPWETLYKFSVRAEAAEIKDADGGTVDTQSVKISLVVRYAITPDKVAHVFEWYSRDGDIDHLIHSAALDAVKVVTARYTAPDLITKRQSVSSDMVKVLGDKAATYGARIINVDITNFSFSAEYMAAINSKVTEEQKRLAMDNQLLTVTSTQKQKVAIAEAEASALKAKADGEAYAVKTKADAEAHAIRVNGDAHASALKAQAAALQVNPLLVEMKKAETWDGKLPQAIYAGAPIPFMQVGK
jgi:prohibitin 2